MTNNDQQLNNQQTVNIDDLHELHPDVISRQATLNIGAIGHVAHGKSSLTCAITGINTVKSSEEKIYNCTIKLGYANAKIFECQNPNCTRDVKYFTRSSDVKDDIICEVCNIPALLVRHISIIDCPGHDDYMTTMLSGAAIMDYTMLVIASDVPCPQPQTIEHLQAIQINDNTKNRIIIAQNKIDLINESQALQNYNQIQKFIGQAIDKATELPIVPISAVRQLNIDYVINEIMKIPIPKRQLKEKPLFISIRSFDTNKTGVVPEKMTGGVIGGTLVRGILRVGDIIEIRPGIIDNSDIKHQKCYPVTTKIISLKTENNDLRYALPGGLIAIGTMLDPALTKKDRMIGQVIGLSGEEMPEIMTKIRFKFNVLINLNVEVNSQIYNDLSKILKTGQEILLTVWGCNMTAIVNETPQHIMGNGDEIVVTVQKPICVQYNTTIAISSQALSGISKNWRLIGYGQNVINAAQKQEEKQDDGQPEEE